MIRHNTRFLTLMYILVDILFIWLAFIFAWVIKFETALFPPEAHLSITTYINWITAYTFIAIIVGGAMGFYSPKRKKTFTYETTKIIQIQLTTTFILLSLLFVFKIVHISRFFLMIFIVCVIMVIWIYRLLLKLGLRKLRELGYNKQFVLILGAGTLGRKFYNNLLMHPELGFEVVGFLDDNVTDALQLSREISILGRISDLETVMATNTVDEVIIALPLDAHNKFFRIIEACEKAGVKCHIIPDFFDILPAKPHFDSFGDMPIINVRELPLEIMINRLFKRSFDITFSIIAIIITLPLMVVIALAIKLSSKGSIIFSQERIGLNRKSFQMYKFRSMKQTSTNESDTTWTVENDTRRTKLGNLLRRTSFDEITQFFNILKGDMSVVGPRPERPYFVEQFKEQIPKYMVKHQVRPGLTGWAQVNGLRGDTSIEERIKHDVYYIENWTFLMDCRIILMTIWIVLKNKDTF